MKKWRQLFQSFFTRYIVGPAPEVTNTSAREPTTDLEMIRFSVWQYLRAAKEHEQLVLRYAADYETIIDELRVEGWKVELGVMPDGALVYVISTDRSRMLA